MATDSNTTNLEATTAQPQSPFQGFQPTDFDLLEVPKSCNNNSSSSRRSSSSNTAADTTTNSSNKETNGTTTSGNKSKKGEKKELELLLADVIKTLAVETIQVVKVPLDVEKELGVMKFRPKVRRVLVEAIYLDGSSRF